MMSINACKGFEYGSGFSGVALRGSEMYLSQDAQLISGGIAGGISDGNPIVFRCVFKPTATNRKTLEALCAEVQKVQEVSSSEEINLTFKTQNSKLPLGRHDACVAVRAVAVVEAMAALVLQDLIPLTPELLNF
jgi:chorismate synthase